MYHLSPSIQFIRNCSSSHDLWLTKTYDIEYHLPYFDPCAWLIPYCFVSLLWVVQQNFVEALILLGQENPLLLVLELRWVGFWILELFGWFSPMFGIECGYPPLVARRVSAKTWSNASTVITCIMCYMLYTEKCKPSNKNANCVFRQLKNYYEMKLWKA